MPLGFGEYTLDVDAHELRRDGQLVPVEPQVFEVLAYLVQHRERVVPKTELLDEIWGDRFVSDSALSSRIKSARKAVGDSGRDQRVIRTIHGRGFRFVASVDERQGGGTVAGGAVTGDAGAERRSVDLAARVREALDAGVGAALDITGGDPVAVGAALDQLYDEAEARGHLVGRGSGTGACLRPYGSVLDALDELVQRRPELLGRLGGGCSGAREAVLAGREPSSRSRLFLCVRELLVAACADRSCLLVIDGLHLAEPDTVALLDAAARLTRHHALVVVAAHSPAIELGSRYEPVEAPAIAHGEPADPRVPVLPAELLEPLRAVALDGATFDTQLFRAATGDPAVADRLLDLGLALGVIEPTGAAHGFRIRVPGLAASLAADLNAHRRAALHLELAGRLERSGSSPERIARHFVAGGRPDLALRHAIAAARRADEAQRYHDVLHLTDPVLDHAKGAERGELLRLRANALSGTGDPTAIPVYREALACGSPDHEVELRAGLARAAVFAGDLEVAREALNGLPDGAGDDTAVLLVRALLSYFEGDLERADQLLAQARDRAGPAVGSHRLLDVIALQGLIAHNRGEWFSRLRRELRAARDRADLAVSIFDGHLCVAEYLLYGPTPYHEVVELAAGLRESAERAGARRAVAFALCVAGEAKLLSGDLEGARVDLEESVRLHRDLGDAGVAHSLQRLAELELASGEPKLARQLLREALVLARWSPISQHLLQRTYGTLIAAAPDADTAMSLVEEAADVLDSPTACELCQVMVEVPATIACAGAGRLDEARRHLALAEWSANYWEGTAWQAAVAEAKATIARAEGNGHEADQLLGRAAELFERAGQVLDAERCRESIGG